MWISPNLLRAATFFSPQGVCEEFKTFQQAVWSKFYVRFCPQVLFSHSTTLVDKFWRAETTGWVIYFSCPGKKSIKRIRHRRDAEFCAPAQKAALSYVLHQARTWLPWRILTGKTCFLVADLHMTAAPQTPPCRITVSILQSSNLQVKNRDMFYLNRR